MTPTYLKTTTGPFTVEYIAHATSEDFDREAGTLGACVREADFSLVFRQTNPEFHDKMTPIIEQLTGVSRQVDAKLTATYHATLRGDPSKAKKRFESFVTFANRAKAITLKREAGEALWAEVEEKALSLSRSIRIDAKPIEREQTYTLDSLEKAKTWLAESDIHWVEDRITKFSEYIGGFKLKRDIATQKPLPDSLASLITQYLRKRNEENLNED